MKLKSLVMLFICLFTSSTAIAGVNSLTLSQVPKDIQTTLGLYFTAKQAYRFVKAHGKDSLFIDVRDPAELQTVGMPTDVDANVPFKRIDLAKWNPKKQRFALTTNPKFASEVSQRLEAKGLTKDAPVILICGSGQRAAKASDVLAKVGYTKVYIVVDGYKAWQTDKLPWSRKMDVKKMYGNPAVPSGS